MFGPLYYYIGPVDHLPMIYIGIDPGLSGSVAVLKDNNVLLLADFPYITVEKKYTYGKRKGKTHKAKKANLAGLAQLFKQCISLSTIADRSDILGAIEKVHPMPGEGVISSWTFASGFYPWLQCFEMENIKYTLVAPQTWKKVFFTGELAELSKEKKGSITVAQKFFPNTKIKHHGQGDALLLALYVKQLLK
jgi:hypothetical protein